MTDKQYHNHHALRQFLDERVGSTLISRILIANHGMAAVKAIRSIRKWCYEEFGNDRTIQLFTMCTPDDISSNAEYILLADGSIQIPSGSPSQTYANIPLICKIAEEYQLDAVWVGWGYASENPELPRALSKLSKRKISFIGPPADAMQNLGDKIASNIIAQTLSIPCLSWSGQQVKLTTTHNNPMTDALFKSASIRDFEHGLDEANRIGTPLMLKASQGGGGRGIRLVRQISDFKNAYDQVRREVPESPIFIMKLLEHARHLEVQVVADMHGNAMTLFGRDCTVQRRHQKIIEEAPISIAPSHVLEEMEHAALRLVQFVGYQGLGTVEFLYDPTSSRYFFLELNPRLQVEHPTTEMISGLNLPAIQVQIAMGIPLHRMRDIRIFYGLQPHEHGMIDFGSFNMSSVQSRPRPKGHVVAARITAENPENGFRPNAGKMLDLNFRSSPNVWGYFSVNASGGVLESADSQIGHVFAYGQTREEARKQLVIALKELSIRAEFATTVPFLTWLLEKDEFVANITTTSWLDGIIMKQVEQIDTENDIIGLKENLTLAICAALSIAHRNRSANISSFMLALSRGHPPNTDLLRVKFEVEFVFKRIQYSFIIYMTSPDHFLVRTKQEDGLFIAATTSILPEKGLLVNMEGRSQVVYLSSEDHGRNDSNDIKITMNGTLYNLSRKMDPTKLTSPSPGRLTRLLVKNGAYISKGEAYAEMEVMKMTMPLNSPRNGVIRFRLQSGSNLKTGEVIANLLLDENESSTTDDVKPFSGPITINGAKRTLLGCNNLSLHNSEQLINQCQHIFRGFYFDESVTRLSQELIDHLLKISEEDNVRSMQVVIELFSSFLEPEMYAHSHKQGDLTDIISRYYRENSEHCSNSDFSESFLLWCQSLTNPKSLSYDLVAELISGVRRLVSHSKVDDHSSLLQKLSEFTCLQVRCRRLYQLAIETRAWLAHRQESRDSSTLASILQTWLTDNMILSTGQENVIKLEEWQSRLSGHGDLLQRLSSYCIGADKNLRLKALCCTLIYLNQIYNAIIIKKHVLNENVMFVWSKVSDSIDAFETPIHVLLTLDEYSELSCALIRDWISKNIKQNDKNPIHLYLYGLSSEMGSSLITKFDLTANFPVSITHASDSSSNITTRYLRSVPSQKNISHSLMENIRPTDVSLLELNRFLNYRLFRLPHVEHNGIFIFQGTAIQNASDQRLFLRHVVLPWTVRQQDITTPDELYAYGSRIMMSMLDSILLAQQGNHNTDCNHIFIHFVPHLVMKIEDAVNALDMMLQMHGRRFLQAGVSTAEIILYLSSDSKSFQKTRFIVTTDSGFIVTTQIYREYPSIDSPPFSTILVPWSDKSDDATSLSPVSFPLEPYPIKTSLQPKRHRAHLMGTTYVYDIPSLFEKATKEALLKESNTTSFSDFTFKAQELVLDLKGRLTLVTRPMGENACGIVAWKINFTTTMSHSEKRCQRDAILIANDITHEMGSFGPAEQALFRSASEYARRHSLPRIYISCSSGARIGLAEEIKEKFKIAWIDDDHPENGIDYLYLDENSYNQISSLTDEQGNPIVEVERIIVPDGAVRYKLLSIVGRDDGFGVENLQGSGAIAGETARAYNDIFTITMVSCRSVGIGAYLARLGHRVIQVQDSSIILTGAGALNKLLGKEVYHSNLQLGGPKIMYHNGISHRIVKNDMCGIRDVVQWLSYVPIQSHSFEDAVSLTHPNIDVPLEKVELDTRLLFTGFEAQESSSKKDSFLQGFFDRGSFMEVMAGWAQSVIVGRARLGGIPIGVIGVETRTTEHIIWADPANPSSVETRIPIAGQVWNPASAFKTAQAIKDMNRGENIPLMIFANWRGFSGGQTDMYDQVLSFGSMIVDELVDYRQPVFVYIIGELRGGAWVVLDSSINSNRMEMYVTPNAKGSILEPEGVVSIKFREKQKLELLSRSFKQERELEPLMDLAHQAALQFADMHDGTTRMLSKKVIKSVVPWNEARDFFYWRLRWLLLERGAISTFVNAVVDSHEDDARHQFDSWIRNQKIDPSSLSTQGMQNNVLSYCKRGWNDSWTAYAKDMGLKSQVASMKDMLKGSPELYHMLMQSLQK